MRFFIFALVAAVLVEPMAQAAPMRFFANPEIQAQAPGAFALQPEAAPFLALLEENTLREGRALAQALRENAEIHSGIAAWPALDTNEQIALLRKIFTVEVSLLGIEAPELVIDAASGHGSAYFDFDLEHPGLGRVFLNPLEIAKETNPYAGLLLLLHETRHSAQFQRAFFPLENPPGTPFAQGIRDAFHAQKSLAGQLGFCDFLTLLNEYEAFLFGNYVVGILTDFQADTLDMGTFASQFDSEGHLKLDLQRLSQEANGGTILEKFNEMEQAQYDLLYGNPR